MSSCGLQFVDSVLRFPYNKPFVLKEIEPNHSEKKLIHAGDFLSEGKFLEYPEGGKSLLNLPNFIKPPENTYTP